jgi:hypothetical protein
MKYCKLHSRKCSVTNKGISSGYLMNDTGEVFAAVSDLLVRLRERFEGDWTNMYGEPASDDFVLEDTSEHWAWTVFPYDDQDSVGNPVAYTDDGQPVRLTVPTYEVRHPLEEFEPQHNA